MKIIFTRSVLVLSILGLSTAVFAQDKGSDTTRRFQKKSFRTLSIGVNGGMLTHYTPFNGPSNGDFRTPEEKLGYGGYIKEQILPGFGIQADFLAGKVNGFRANSLATGSEAQENSSFETQIAWSAALSALCRPVPMYGTLPRAPILTMKSIGLFLSGPVSKLAYPKS